jgi:3-isopropylmalate/(R)-2-methylmalate dehydratase small subunit
MKPFATLTSRMIVIPKRNIDTDQIIPARFLKTISRAGLGTHLFADWRYCPDGSDSRDFPLNAPGAENAQILLTGDNFGCGSSREHAPWALIDFGFRAVISTSFADIFRQNALKNGLLPLAVDQAAHNRLLTLATEAPDSEITIDLAAQFIGLPDGSRAPFPIDAFSKACLLEGVDSLSFLLKHQARINVYEETHQPLVNTQIG